MIFFLIPCIINSSLHIHTINPYTCIQWHRMDIFFLKKILNKILWVSSSEPPEPPLDPAMKLNLFFILPKDTQTSDYYLVDASFPMKTFIVIDSWAIPWIKPFPFLHKVQMKECVFFLWVNQPMVRNVEFVQHMSSKWCFMFGTF